MAYTRTQPLVVPEPKPLVLYKFVPICCRDQCEQYNVLRREESYIALRENWIAALEREQRKCAGGVNKESHFVLKVTFNPLGISHFTTSHGDESSQFKSLLHKVPCDGPVDWGCWRFTSDLPLSICSNSGQVMVESELLYIM